jgi:putative flippase GtrA
VLQAMRTFRFDVMGASRTYWHFYVGFGAYITVLLLMQAVLLWQLASLAASHPSPARAMIGTLLAANIAGTIVVWRFIFALPAALSLVCAVCVALSFLTARSTIARS